MEQRYDKNGIGNGKNEESFLTFEIAGCIVPLYDAARPSINPTVVLSCSYKGQHHREQKISMCLIDSYSVIKGEKRKKALGSVGALSAKRK